MYREYARRAKYTKNGMVRILNYTSLLMLLVIIAAVLGCLYFLRLDWKRYGLLFLASAISANSLCYTFTCIGFYSFPNNVLHNDFLIPYGLVSTAFPLIVMFGVRYSPEKWAWKIAFYWGIIHLGVLSEVILKNTSIFDFNPEWDLWDSYTLWWLYYLLFELLGGKIIPGHLRKPIDASLFRYGGWAWIVLHIIVITTIFLAGVYVGITILNYPPLSFA
ncbi:MAG: CBO0543 family protein [Ectobacillus sp.]